jgi:translation initiation factor 2 alpha subunit (eIF-2alpha)
VRVAHVVLEQAYVAGGQAVPVAIARLEGRVERLSEYIGENVQVAGEDVAGQVALHCPIVNGVVEIDRRTLELVALEGVD